MTPGDTDMPGYLAHVQEVLAQTDGVLLVIPLVSIAAALLQWMPGMVDIATRDPSTGRSGSLAVNIALKIVFGVILLVAAICAFAFFSTP